MTKKVLYYTVGGIATAVAGYYAYRYFSNKTYSFGEDDSLVVSSPTKGGSKTNTPKGTKTTTTDFPLKKGSRGEKVVKLQKYLNESNSESLATDGIFGALTEQAVKGNQMPFNVFKTMHPYAVEGQVSKEFYDSFIKNSY